MDMHVYTLLALLWVAAAVDPPEKSNCKSAVFNVATLQQNYNCCRSDNLNNGGGVEELRSQYVALQNRVQTLENQLSSLNKQGKYCDDALINGAQPVSDNQLSASSTHNDCPISKSRVYSDVAWCAGAVNDAQWIQVDLGRLVTVTAIATQGRNRSGQRVLSYTVSLSNDGRIWRPYTEDTVKQFGGNWDNEVVNKNYLRSPVSARFVRINPKTWNQYISLRWEVYGCRT